MPMRSFIDSLICSFFDKFSKLLFYFSKIITLLHYTVTLHLLKVGHRVFLDHRSFLLAAFSHIKHNRITITWVTVNFTDLTFLIFIFTHYLDLDPGFWFQLRRFAGWHYIRTFWLIPYVIVNVLYFEWLNNFVVALFNQHFFEKWQISFWFLTRTFKQCVDLVDVLNEFWNLLFMCHVNTELYWSAIFRRRFNTKLTSERLSQSLSCR